MPAPDLQTLQAIPDAVEAALKTRLNAIVPAFAQREADSLPPTRVDIMFTQGQWSGHWGLRTNGEIEEAAWHFTLTLNLYSRRPAPGQPDAHAGYAAALKRATIDASRDPAFLPFHTLAELHAQAYPERVVIAQDQDYSSIIYTGLVVIRSDAWPIE